MYLTLDEYKELSGTISDEKTINKMLIQSSRYIDILTYNRIKNLGFEKCSDWEKEIIKECQCEIIDFYYTNSDYIDSYLDSYSLNGVSISFGNSNSNVEVINGVVVRSSTYRKLNMTRFTCLSL